MGINRQEIYFLPELIPSIGAATDPTFTNKVTFPKESKRFIPIQRPLPARALSSLSHSDEGSRG